MRRISDELFAVNLRKILKTHGHLEAFEKTLTDERETFDVRLTHPVSKHLLAVKVLPRTETVLQVPVVEVTKTDLLNGRAVRNLTLRLAVKPEGWLPYAIDDTPGGVRHNGLDQQGKLQREFGEELALLSQAFARQLVEQGWAGQKPAQTQSVKPKL
jgi:hypothetical protein